nr:hypothetical protein [Saprospiraceae bacterium]
LPAAINSNKVEFNAYIDADEQFILYTAYRREGNSGSGDIYIYHLKMKKDTGVPLQTLDLRSMIPDSPIALMSRLIKNTFSSLPADGPPRHLTVKKTSNK